MIQSPAEGGCWYPTAGRRAPRLSRVRATSPVRSTITVLGRRLEPEHHRLRDFLTRAAQPFDWVEAGTPEAQALLSEHGLADAELPVVIAGEKRVEAATVERLAEAWHVSDPPARRSSPGWPAGRRRASGQSSCSCAG